MQATALPQEYEQRPLLRLIRRFEQAAETLAGIKDELAHDMRRAMAGHQEFVPSVVDGARGSHETISAYIVEVMAALQDGDVQFHLADVLKNSRCLTVVILRSVIQHVIDGDVMQSPLSALDHAVACEQFKRVLRDSECGHVNLLREAVTGFYVLATAQKLADVRGAR